LLARDPAIDGNELLILLPCFLDKESELNLISGFGVLMDLPAEMLQLLQSCRTLPSVPAVVLQVLDLSQDPEIGTAKLSKVIARDPALAVKILKVANSAWCGVRTEITTLDRAVNLVGLNGAMSLALSFSLVRGLQKTGNSSFDHQAYWRRSLIAATATRRVGIYTNATNKDELFLAGLLQDIGMLVLCEALPAYPPIVVSSENDHAALVEIERKVMNTDHAQVGSWFLRRWGLPGRLVDAIECSHQREGMDGPLARSVAVGSWIADIWTNPNTTAATEAAADAVKTILRLPHPQLDEILAKIATDLPEATANLDIAVGDEAFINRLLDQAREALAELNLRAVQEARNFAVQAQRDALTSLYNRTYLNQILEEQFAISRSTSQPLTLIFLDIDRFKNINDSYGHHSGDAVLVSVSQMIQAATRSYDIIVRFGGDEFVVLLANADASITAEIAERIRATIEQKQHDSGDGKFISVTVSIGWAMSSSAGVSCAKDMLEAADRSLYSAKAAGRNRVAQAL
jgi:diguanylate cyclase (GGDEF)-like protein